MCRYHSCFANSLLLSFSSLAHRTDAIEIEWKQFASEFAVYCGLNMALSGTWHSWFCEESVLAFLRHLLSVLVGSYPFSAAGFL
jgi:hypothetical protein